MSTLAVSRVTDVDGDYAEFYVRMASVSGDLYAGDCGLTITYEGRSVELSNLIRITRDGRASELTRFVGTTYDPEIVALYAAGDSHSPSPPTAPARTTMQRLARRSTRPSLLRTPPSTSMSATPR